jgi:UPF0042 nucleotide-binding protein
MSVVLLTGLSGSGKTTALRALEDLGFLCMDNLPVVLLPSVIELVHDSTSTANLAVVVDVRNRRFIEGAAKVVDDLVERGVELRIAFLDAQPERIIQRFSETRRRHPLERDGDLAQAISDERRLLDDLRARAAVVIDTSELTVHDLRRAVQQRLGDGSGPAMTVKLTSFGFKYGAPAQADLLFDVRFVTNPYFVERLRDSTGLDSEVAAFVLEQDGVSEFIERVVGLLDFLIPRYRDEGKAYLTIGIGCTGGKHRSVALTEQLGAALRSRGVDLVVEHRERASWTPPPITE